MKQDEPSSRIQYTHISFDMKEIKIHQPYQSFIYTMHLIKYSSVEHRSDIEEEQKITTLNIPKGVKIMADID